MNLLSCTPLVIYGLLAIFSIASSALSSSKDKDASGVSVQQLIGHATVLLILGLLCSRGYNMGAWAVLLLLLIAPMILISLAVIMTAAVASAHN